MGSVSHLFSNIPQDEHILEQRVCVLKKEGEKTRFWIQSKARLLAEVLPRDWAPRDDLALFLQDVVSPKGRGIVASSCSPPIDDCK